VRPQCKGRARFCSSSPLPRFALPQTAQKPQRQEAGASTHSTALAQLQPAAAPLAAPQAAALHPASALSGASAAAQAADGGDAADAWILSCLDLAEWDDISQALGGTGLGQGDAAAQPESPAAAAAADASPTEASVHACRVAAAAGPASSSATAAGCGSSAAAAVPAQAPAPWAQPAPSSASPHVLRRHLWTLLSSSHPAEAFQHWQLVGQRQVEALARLLAPLAHFSAEELQEDVRRLQLYLTLPFRPLRWATCAVPEAACPSHWHTNNLASSSPVRQAICQGAAGAARQHRAAPQR
jgi:hypothetical protein